MTFVEEKFRKICKISTIDKLQHKYRTIDVVFDLFPGRMYTITSTCTFIRVKQCSQVGHTHTHRVLCTPVLEINQRRHLVRYLCCNLSMMATFFIIHMYTTQFQVIIMYEKFQINLMHFVLTAFVIMLFGQYSIILSVFYHSYSVTVHFSVK